ncbi:unnamed protein product [Arabis nemorensis]|uniref:FAF domain-containing protein n=1 Tax=Arabis nemorensis TaxID=586526 RepID=A0A565C0D0_9BRAS|nr:unnamed protein product [Arabis nemorensis]
MSVIVRQAYEHLPNNQITQNANVSGWSFLQFLSETKHIVQNREDDTNKTPYVHPIEKRPVAKLSLEMCTESLGTENGSESGDEISLLAIEATNMSMIPLTTKPDKVTDFTVRENIFPPPLNFSVNYSRMVKLYEEDGRLVVQAIRVCSPPRCFVSERREGRLRLCLLSQDGDKEFEENESEFRRSRRRCNENGHEAKTMRNWNQQQQFWVAT